MLTDDLQKLTIDTLFTSPALDKIREEMQIIEAVWQKLFVPDDSADSKRLDLLKIATVFQIFFIDILASGKKAGDLTEEDWKVIAKKVICYGVLADGQAYSVFVFSLYADFIDASIQTLQGKVKTEHLDAVAVLSKTIRENTLLLKNKKTTEVAYIEACLWLSLEAMIKLLSLSLETTIGEEYGSLVMALSQLAFEYGRYVLFAKENAILEEYINNQYALDEKLKTKYETYLLEVKEQSERFQGLVNAAFEADFKDALSESAELARAAGVKDSNLLTSIDEIDAFFLL